MEIALIVVSLAALVFGVVGFWLFWSQMRLKENQARAIAERDAARQMLEPISKKLEQLEPELDSLKKETTELSGQLEREQNQHKLLLKSRDDMYGQKEHELQALHGQRERELNEREKQLAQRMADLNEKFDKTFRALAAEALKTSNEEFLKLAVTKLETTQKESKAELDERKIAVEQLVKPISQTLKETREKLEELEKTRTKAFATLYEQVTQMTSANAQLKDETGRLTKALSRPEIRGRYGEIQLRRVAELAGMTRYCDFTEQSSVRDPETGKLLRPDMIVTLPNERKIVVDAKANIDSYIQAVNAQSDEERQEHLEHFARNIVDQTKKLGDKKYWSLYKDSPDFVVMFVPGDHFIDAALSQRPELIEIAAENNVILASPSTLIGLLRAVAVGWREYQLAEEANELLKLGKELHSKAAIAFGYAASLGKSIGQTVDRYNQFASSVESRLMPTLRKFEDTGVKSAKELPEFTEVTVTTKLLEGSKLVESNEAGDRVLDEK